MYTVNSIPSLSNFNICPGRLREGTVLKKKRRQHCDDLEYNLAPVVTVQCTEKKDGDRSKGKGHCVCFGDNIYSIPCHASYFASVDLKETDEFNLFFEIDLGKTGSRVRN